jgi:hypothetical protein
VFGHCLPLAFLLQQEVCSGIGLAWVRLVDLIAEEEAAEFGWVFLESGQRALDVG